MQVLPSDEETLAVEFHVIQLQLLAHEVLRKHKSCSVQQLADAWSASRPQQAASPTAAVPACPHVAAGPDTPAVASCSGAPTRAAQRPAGGASTTDASSRGSGVVHTGGAEEGGYAVHQGSDGT